MQEYLKLKPSGCKDCYKCIRSCPVKAISFADNQAQIIEDECILCGECYVVCPQNAKQVRGDVKNVRDAVRGGKRVIASVAPSFVAGTGFATIEDMADTLRQMGFESVEETAIGAQFVSREYERMISAGDNLKGRVMITSCCPAINSLIQKYYPDLLDKLARVLTPMQAHCKAIKERDSDAYTVFIGPCIAKKKEADESNYVDACLTFDELNDWMNIEGIHAVNKPRTEENGKRSRFYPTTGGIVKSMDIPEGLDVITLDGTESCMAALDEIRAGTFDHAFIEMSACKGSCVNGPILREHAERPLAGVVKVASYAGKADFEAKAPQNISAQYAPAGLRRVMPGSAAIQEVLRAMGKTTPDKELNCGCCGYPTCRDKAAAVCMGKAEIGMCLPFLREKAESFSDKIISSTPNAIIVMNEDLIVQQVNMAAQKLFKLRSPDDIVKAPIVRLLDPSDYMMVVQTGHSVVNKCHYIPEYKIYVEETITYDKQYKILISIMRDVSEREQTREQELELKRQTVEVTDKVIDKQMRVVQEIASLLGETTAETKLALTKLKDAMQDG